MTRAKPSGSAAESGFFPLSPIPGASIDVNFLRDIDGLKGDLKDKIIAIHTSIMQLRTNNNLQLDILLFFSGYNEELLLKAECADTHPDRELLLHLNRTVSDLLGYPPSEIEQKIAGLLKLLHYVIRLESGALVQKEQVVNEIDGIDESCRQTMLTDLMPGFVIPFQMPLQSNLPNLRNAIEKLIADPENSIVSKILSRGKQNLQRTNLEGIGPAEWILFYDLNKQLLADFEQLFYKCVDKIVSELEKNEKYDVKSTLDEFMAPYLRVEARKWSRE